MEISSVFELYLINEKSRGTIEFDKNLSESELSYSRQFRLSFEEFENLKWKNWDVFYKNDIGSPYLKVGKIKSFWIGSHNTPNLKCYIFDKTTINVLIRDTGNTYGILMEFKRCLYPNGKVGKLEDIKFILEVPYFETCRIYQKKNILLKKKMIKKKMFECLHFKNITFQNISKWNK